MCGSCHLSGSSYGAVMEGAASDLYAFGINSHGSKMSLGDMPPGTEPMGSGLPYVGSESGIFQCSTCHNPHDDSNRPFLRSQMDSLCARCHTQRNFVGGIEKSGTLAATGSWGMGIAGGAGNPGSHPVGEDIVGDRPGGPVVTIGSHFRTPFSPNAGEWSIGPHLSNGVDGGVICVTCHAVHGKQPDEHDAGFTGVSEEPKPAFLSVEQSEGTISGYGRPVANGAGESNPLCEACHGVGNNPARAHGGIAWADGGHNVNPGLPGTFSHPIDSYPSGYDTGVSNFPDSWPLGSLSLAGDNVSTPLICETCHVPHPKAALEAGRGDVLPGAGAFILRAPAVKNQGGDALCDMCHTEEVAGHHPIDKAFDSAGVFYFQNSSGGPADRLTCATCHVSAHNWVEPGWPGLDPSWLPFDNGRSINQAVDMYNPDMSKTCMDCHYFMDGDGKSVSPTMGTAQTVIETSSDEYLHYQIEDKSMGTHYIGKIHEDGKWLLAPIVDVFDTTRTWKAQALEYSSGLADGWSRFGGQNRVGSRVLVCESCHELEPDKNGGFKHLLLAPHEEGNNGMNEYSGDSDGRDILCEACHGVPAGTHPMTGSIVTKTNEVLDTNADWVRRETLGYATMGIEGSMSCDSCHQVHDANTNSYTYCLDAPNNLNTEMAESIEPGTSGIMTGYGELRGPAQYLEANGQLGTYVTPKLGDVKFSILCQQCHFH